MGMLLIILKSMTDIVFESIIASRENMIAYEETMSQPVKANPEPKVSLSSVSSLKAEPVVENPSEKLTDNTPEIAPSRKEEKKGYCSLTATSLQKVIEEETRCSDPLPDRLTTCLSRASTCVDVYPKFLKERPVFNPEDPFVQCVTEKGNCYKEEPPEVYPSPQVLSFLDRCNRHDEFVESDIAFYIKELKSDCPSLDNIPAIVNCKTFAYMCEEAKGIPEEKLQELNQLTQCFTKVNNCIDLY